MVAPVFLICLILESTNSHFSRFGKILNLLVNVREGKALLHFRTKDHAKMIIEQVRGNRLSGQRFQIDVASVPCQAHFMIALKPTPSDAVPSSSSSHQAASSPALHCDPEPDCDALNVDPYTATASRTIKLMLTDKQSKVLQTCPKQKVIDLFQNYGYVVDLHMPDEVHPFFFIEYLDILR
jgi:hypothetical protein